MGFKCGIVGLPNVGKSTLFNALTKAGIEAANYPFCTIEPNIGVVPVPDKRLKNLVSISHSKEIIPAVVRFVDIAGLVAGAATGEGLGNKFLANIRETQAIAHVIRCFDNDDITHVAGKVNPIADIEVINTELGLADLETIDKALQKLEKDIKRGDKDAKTKQELFQKIKKQLNDGVMVRQMALPDDERFMIADLHLLTAKPVLYIANVDESGLHGNDYLTQVTSYAEAEGAIVVPVCAAIEAEIAELSDVEQQEFLSSLGLAESGLSRVIHAGYDLLGLQTYFTVGPKEARAWTIPKGATAPRAAAEIHTDFEKGFIRAEVMSYDDYMQYKGEQGTKEAGKWHLEGKDYIVKDGDIIVFRFNV